MYKKLLLSTIIFSAFSLTSFGQVNINKNHLPQVGDSVSMATLEDGNVDLGQASNTAQTWDFSSLADKEDTTDLLIYLDPASTEHNIANTDMALMLDIKISGINVKDGFFFFSEQDSGIYIETIVADLLGKTAVLESSDPELFFPFPMKYGDVFTDDSRYSGQMDAQSILRESSKVMTVDAFGTLTLPGDSTFEVIRLKEVVTSTDVISQNGMEIMNETSVETRYQFFTNDSILRHPIFTAYINNDQEMEHVSWMSFEKIEIDSTAKSIRELTQKDIDWRAYPNPAHDALKLNISNLETDVYELEVYNFVGQLIETYLIEGGEELYTVNTRALSNGVYFITLNDSEGNRIISDRFNVAH